MHIPCLYLMRSKSTGRSHSLHHARSAMWILASVNQSRWQSEKRRSWHGIVLILPHAVWLGRSSKYIENDEQDPLRATLCQSRVDKGYCIPRRCASTFHQVHLREVFQHLREVKLTLKGRQEIPCCHVRGTLPQTCLFRRQDDIWLTED